ncbi:hypothetical protein [Vibrio splendidus]|uniref:hypothetical protein n=1 Tax=Vibrio splendidus TaxID=29497 RepID=UPI0011B22E74|nr:hypothetical protein [Vibrio splendidus]
MDSYRQTISTDANLTDQDGKSIMVDCSVTLPLLFGQPAEVRVGIPNEVMPIPNLKTPWQVKTFQGAEIITLENVHYRRLTTDTLLKRKLGSIPVNLSHIQSLTINMVHNSPDYRFSIYISDTEYFRTLSIEEGQNGISQIAMFSHPTLGEIILQKYSVESATLSGNGSLKLHGYRLEVECDRPNTSPEAIINEIQPLLDILSFFSRQRVLVLGWEHQTESEYIRHWKYPLNAIQTNYSLYEPRSYLMSRKVDELEKMINIGLSNYYGLEDSEQDMVHKLSFNLCSSLERRDDAKYMALFTALESYAKKLSLRLEPDETRSKSIQLIKKAAKPHQKVDHDVYKMLMSLTSDIKKTSAADSIENFLFKHRVLKEDLWSIQGKGGLLKIRNHLAHEGNHNVDHQGLAVATLHLTILIERVILGVLNLKLESSVQRDLRQEPWLNLEYANRLKNLIIQNT